MDSLFLNSYMMNPHQTSTTKDIPLDPHLIECEYDLQKKSLEFQLKFRISKSQGE